MTAAHRFGWTGGPVKARLWHPQLPPQLEARHQRRTDLQLVEAVVALRLPLRLPEAAWVVGRTTSVAASRQRISTVVPPAVRHRCTGTLWKPTQGMQVRGQLAKLPWRPLHRQLLQTRLLLPPMQNSP